VFYQKLIDSNIFIKLISIDIISWVTQTKIYHNLVTSYVRNW